LTKRCDVEIRFASLDLRCLLSNREHYLTRAASHSLGLRLWNCFCFSWSGSWFATGRTNARSRPALGQPPDRKKGRKDCPCSPLERVEG